MKHWGLALAFWLLQDRFPLHNSTVQQILNLPRKQFWALTDELVKRRIIWLRWDKKFKLFHAFFTPAKTAHVSLTPAKTAHVATPAKIAHVSLTPAKTAGVDVHTGQNRLGGGGVYISNTTTTQETRLALAGEPWECLLRWIPDFQAGFLIPHLQEAKALDPENAVARLRGAVFTLDDRFLRGVAPKNPMAALMSYVQKNHVLEQKSKFGQKKVMKETSKPFQTPQDTERDKEFARKMASLTFDEAKAEVLANPLFRHSKKTYLQNYIALLKQNPCRDQFQAWAESELSA